MASEIKVSADSTGFAEALNQMLEESLAENEAALREHVKDACKVAKSDLRENSPKKTGEYAKGWTYTAKETAPGSFTGVVYQKSKPGLTHLLEKGHAKRNGGRVAGIPHIGPAFEDARKTLEEGTE